MLKQISTFAITALLAFSVNAAKFKAGEDYQVLDLPKSQTPTVTEFFSFYCPHCYRSQELMKKLEAQLPENVSFNKNPVSFMGGNMGKSFGKAFATSMMLNVEEKISPILFKKIHEQQKPPRTDEELRQIFIDEGIDEKKYDGTYSSFAVNGMANRFDKAFEATGLTGVPAVVVNGKYHVTPKTIKTQDDYNALINYLLTL